MKKAAMKKAAMKAAMKVVMKKAAMKVVMKKAAMKVVMKKAMKKAMKSLVAKGKRAKSSVWRGTKVKTSGGLTKDKLMMNKSGKVVSKAASAAAKKRCSHLVAWGKAVASARKALDMRGFVAVGGKSAAGKALFAKAKSLYNA